MILDDDFEVLIKNGDGNIVRGYDEEKGLSYYKLYFRDENDISMKTAFPFILSFIAIVLSIVAICVSCPRSDMSFDYLGLITGVLGVLVTVLVGWNIYMIIDFKQEKEKLQQYFDEQKKEVRSVGNDVIVTFKNQISQSALLEKNIADVYSQLMGLNKTIPLSFNYLFHLLGAIVSASQAENYDACNIWLAEIQRTLTSPDQIVMPVSCKKHLIEALMQIHKSDSIHGLDEVVNLIAQINVIPDPIS